MRVKVEATTVWFEDGDELVKKYPFLKDECFEIEMIPTGHHREFYSQSKKKWVSKEETEVYITIDSLETLQFLVESVKKETEDAYNGQTILMVDDDGDWYIEIYDGYRE